MEACRTLPADILYHDIIQMTRYFFDHVFKIGGMSVQTMIGRIESLNYDSSTSHMVHFHIIPVLFSKQNTDYADLL